MEVTLKIKNSEDYFSAIGLEVDWDENDTSKVSMSQEEAISKILSTEISIFILRRTSSICGRVIDTMISIRRELITAYEKLYGSYIEHNDFY